MNNLYKNRLISYFKAPDIEDAEAYEGDFIDRDVRAVFEEGISKDIHMAKIEGDLREKTGQVEDKVRPIMNKASKLL